MQVLGKRGMSLRTSGVAVAVMRASFLWRGLAVLVIVAMLAHWTWVLFAPGSTTVLPATQATSEFQTERLFGVASVSAVVSVMPNVRLVGVFAGNPGFAVLEIDGKRQVGLPAGAEIIAGAKLAEVAIDHVLIERGGVRQRIDMVKPIPGKAADAPGVTVVSP